MTEKLRGKGRKYGKKCGVTQGNSQLTVSKDKVCECVTNQKVKVAEAEGDLRKVMSEWKPRHGAKFYTIKHYAFHLQLSTQVRLPGCRSHRLKKTVIQ